LTRSINWGLYGTKIRSAQHRGIVRTIRCCLASVSATMKGGEITCKALIYFQKPCCFSMPGIYTYSSNLKSFPEFQRLCHSVCGICGESLPDVNYFEVSLVFQECFTS